MSQAHNESFNSIRSEDNDDDQAAAAARNDDDGSGSGDGSSSGSDSDTDSSTSSSDSSDAGGGIGGNAASNQKPQLQRQASTKPSQSQPNAKASNATKSTTTTTENSGGPRPTPTVAAARVEDANANGYTDDDTGSDSGSDSNSNDSNDDDDEDDAVDTGPPPGSGRQQKPTPLPATSTSSKNSTSSQSANNKSNNTTTTTNTSTSSSSNNTSNTTNLEDEDDDDDEDDEDDADEQANCYDSASAAAAGTKKLVNHQQLAKASTPATATAAAALMQVNNNNNSKNNNSRSNHLAAAAADDAADDDDASDDSAESGKSSSDSSAEESHSASSSSNSSEDEEDDYQPKRTTRPVRKAAAPAEKLKKPAKKKKRKQNWDSEESDESDEDSDDSLPPKRKPPAAIKNNSRAQQQQRKSKKTYSSDDSEDDSKRFATRRATAAAVSYKEASEDERTDSEDLLEVENDENQADAAAAAAAAAEEDEKCETIERILARRRGRKGCTGNQTTIYAIEESGTDPNEGVDEHDLANTEIQFHIKWKGWSYIHNTWESEATLREQKVKGMKKLDNFIKKERELECWRRYAGPEDIDYFECQLELQNDLLKSYNNVDRIIARNTKEDGASEYLCKWQSLPYAEATWEDATLVLRKWQRCVTQYEEREISKCTPSRHAKVLKCRPKFYKVKGQPEFLNEPLLLRDYQMDGLNWLLHSWCKDNSVILADEMGLGKTIQTICFLYSMFKLHHLYGPFLCVVPLSTMTAWQREFELWGPELNVVTYLGDVKSREMIRQYEWQFEGSKRLKFNCILTTYEIVLKDKLFLGTLQWAALLVDEAHRLKNDDSLLYKSLKEFDTNHRLLITGTPLQNSLKELWALLHFIMPDKFDTWENFELQHGNAADKGYTKLHQQLEPFILRRVKKDVEKSLPAKVEQILRVEMTSVQKQYYKWILTKNFDALRKGKKGSTSTFLNIVIELKKCCNHAALIRPNEFELFGMHQDEALQTLLKGSGKLVLLDKLLCRLKETGHRVLIFSQMVRMLDVLADYLQKRHFPFQRLDGSIKGEMRRQALDHFNADGSQDFCFLLSTRAGGLGINLATADTVIIFDSDWNPQNDLQAQARAHRIGQKNQVNIYRLVTARSVEEQIVERAKQKMVLDHLVIQRMDTTGRTVLDKSGAGGTSANTTPFNKDDLSAILKFGAEELFKDEQENDDELVCDIDEILRRAETRNEDPEMPGDDLLSAFKVASIAAFEEEPGGEASAKDHDADMEEDTKDWDDIIPENLRKIVESEERAKEMEDLYLPPRRKTANAAPATGGKRGVSGSAAEKQDSGADSDYDAGSDASGDEPRTAKRRGRPTLKEKIVGFTDTEIRRFIKSYKKFPAPLMRLEAIACDAELQEKPLAELKRIGEMLHDRCIQFFKAHKEEGTTAPKVAAAAEDAKQKRSRATYSVKLGGVSFNAKTLLACEEELQPLNELMPSTAAERLNWALNIKTRPANFDVDWGVDEDSKLLCGIYQYGIGSWEQMKMDPSLRLSEKLLLNDTRKPQAKHLQSRSEYLLKIIKKNVELRRGVQRKQRKPRKGKGKAAPPVTPEGKLRLHSETHGDEGSQSGTGANSKMDATDADGGLSNDADGATATTTRRRTKRNSGTAGSHGVKDGKAGGGAGGTKARGKSGNADAVANNKPMHFTANNEPRALEVLGDLDPNIFNECKEKMRPVKKALKALDRPDSSLSNQEQARQTRECLLSIGKQIEVCLEAYSKESEKKEWRSNLWYFVSKFTEFDAKKLFKLYKHTLKASTPGATPAATDHQAADGKKATPLKRGSKDIYPQSENGTDFGAFVAKDKSAKKKKKDKERDRDKNQRYSGGSPSGAGLRMSLDSPMKRKRDESDVGAAGSMSSEAAYKRMNMESSSRSRDRNNERKKHHHHHSHHHHAHHPADQDYYGGGRGGGMVERDRDRNDRRGSMNNSSPSGASITSRGSMHGIGGNSRLPPGYGPPQGDGVGRLPLPPYGESDRWGGHSRDRYGPADYKRDRYDNNFYHRERDRDRRPDKRRYAHPPLGYPPHYMPPNYFMGPNGVLPPPPGGVPPPPHTSAYRGRMDYPPDYRRGGSGGDYDRRTQT